MRGKQREENESKGKGGGTIPRDRRQGTGKSEPEAHTSVKVSVGGHVRIKGPMATSSMAKDSSSAATVGGSVCCERTPSRGAPHQGVFGNRAAPQRTRAQG